MTITKSSMKKYRPFLFGTIILLPFLFFIGGPNQYSPRSMIHAWNLGHILYFALLPWTLLSARKGKDPEPWCQVGAALGLAVIIGTLMELLQSRFGRTFDPYDLLRNVIGAMVGISFLLPVKKRIPGIIKVATMLLVATQLYPVTISLIDESNSRHNFPILSDFQSPFQIHRWEGNTVMSIAGDIGSPGNYALEAILSGVRYPGVSLKYFQPDWRRYKRFQFNIFNPSSSPLDLTCRIHDEWHAIGPQRYEDRFSKIYRIVSGWNTITVNLEEVRQAPKLRLMDLKAIRSVGIFTTSPDLPRTIYIDELILY